MELTTIICNLKWLRIEDCCSKFIQIIYYVFVVLLIIDITVFNIRTYVVDG